MKNRVLVIMCAILILLLSACGKTAEAQPSPTPAASTPVPVPTASAEPEPSSEPTEFPDETDTGEVSPELVEFLDAYEQFVDEYVEFMGEYLKNPTDMNLLLEYTSMLQEYAEFAEKIEKYDAEDMSLADALYYSEVCLRCSQKLMKVVG